MIGLANRYILGNEPSERAPPPGVPLSACSRIFAKHSTLIRYIDIITGSVVYTINTSIPAFYL